MGSLSNFAENALMNHLCNTAFTPAATLFVALCRANQKISAPASIAKCPISTPMRVRRSHLARPPAGVSCRVPGHLSPGHGGRGTISHWAIVSCHAWRRGCVCPWQLCDAVCPGNGNTPTIPSTELEVEIGRTHYTASTISATAPGTLNDSANNFRCSTSGAPSTLVALPARRQ